MSELRVLVVGASGATGRLAVRELLANGNLVTAVVRDSSNVFDSFTAPSQLSVKRATLLALSDSEIDSLVTDCDAIISCLGHNLTFAGLFGKPHMLVTMAVRRLYSAIERSNPNHPIKFVLMNSSGISNKDIPEVVSLPHRCINLLLRHLLPPHRDNEHAAELLRTEIGHDNQCTRWVIVRPDSLINQDVASSYSAYPSPTRSPLFNPGKTSRINVGNFMMRLLTDKQLWDQWEGQMPVLYNDK